MNAVLGRSVASAQNLDEDVADWLGCVSTEQTAQDCVLKMRGGQQERKQVRAKRDKGRAYSTNLASGA